MTDPVIRPYRGADLESLYEICLLTGAEGGDATERHADPRVLGEVWAAPYPHFAPELTFVIEDDDGVGGYVVGVADTAAFERWADARWWPQLRDRYPAERFLEGSADLDAVNLIHSPLRMPADLLVDHPAHLHIDMVPRLQGRGLGRGLLDHLFAGLRAAGAGGVHLGVSPLNTNAVAFYEHLGFAWVIDDWIMARSTEPL